MNKIIDIHAPLGDIFCGQNITFRTRLQRPDHIDDSFAQNARDGFVFKAEGRTAEQLQDRMREGQNRLAHATCENLGKSMDDVQAAYSVALPILPYTSFDEYLAASRLDPRILPFSCPDYSLPQDETLEKLRQDIANGARGLKIHSVLSNLPMTDPRTLDIDLTVEQPERFEVNDNLIIPPVAPGEEASAQVVRGPNIKPFPLGKPLSDDVTGSVLLKMEDNITTDHIMPSNAKLLPYRSNVPHLADFCLTPVDETFPARAKAEGGGMLVAGSNYGQGSSREHAALVPLYLGIRAVAAKSFARIHQANLINNGILPLTFRSETDYDDIDLMDELALPGIRAAIEDGAEVFILRNVTKGHDYQMDMPLTKRQRGMLLCGGLLNYTRESQS